MSKKNCVMYLCAAVAACAAGQARAELMAPALTLDPSVLTLADAASPAKDWVDEAKNPFAGFTWGADERLRLEGYNNAVTLDQAASGHDVNFFRYRTRIFGTYVANDNLAFNARLEWEGRHYQNPQPVEWYDGQGLFDIFNVKLTLPQLATTVIAGRQEIILGDGWLVLEGTPLDGSTTIFFDAVRSTTELKDLQTSVELIYIQQYSSPKQWLPTLGDTDLALTENDEVGAIVYATNKSIKNVEISPYFIYKHDKAVATNGDNADIYTVGARVEHGLTENLKAKVEGAYQFGNKDGAAICAWGLNSRLSYCFNDAMSNELRLNFEYLSGDNPGTENNEAFDPLWGRWPQWSELFVYTDIHETRVAQTTNLMRIGPEYVVKPTKETELTLRYNALFANQNDASSFITDGGNFRGHLFSAILKYKINRHLSGHLWGEYLVPGNYYQDDNRDNAVFFRAELFLTF